MHLRTFISTVLISALMPLSSLAGICEINCRMLAMASPVVQPSADAAHADHHHSHDMMMPSGNGTAGQASSTPRSMDHRCCNQSRATLSNPCSISMSNDLQEQRVSPKSGQELATVQTLIPDSPRIRQHLNRRSSAKLFDTPVSSLPLPLRI